MLYSLSILSRDPAASSRSAPSETYASGPKTLAHPRDANHRVHRKRSAPAAWMSRLLTAPHGQPHLLGLAQRRLRFRAGKACNHLQATEIAQVLDSRNPEIGIEAAFRVGDTKSVGYILALEATHALCDMNAVTDPQCQ